MLIGILKPNNKLTDVETIFIMVAQNRGHKAFVFSARDVNFSERKIFGKTIEKGRVVDDHFSFPDIIQNRLSVSEYDIPTYVRLAREIYFTTHHIETKLDIYKRMKDHELMREYVLDSKYCRDFSDLIFYINKYDYVIVKPLSSKQAIGIFTIKKNGDLFIFKELGVNLSLNEKDLEKVFHEKTFNQYFLVSPFFFSQTNNGLASVFRLHMVLGGDGKWERIKFFPYVNLDNNQDIANGLQGALISTREELFLQQFYPGKDKDILLKVDKIFHHISSFMTDLYDWPIDAIGVDIGVNQNGEIKIFEINAGPGVGFMAYPVAEKQILYYEWVCENNKKVKVNNFLPKRYRRYYNNVY
ncbi:hypothetical protein F2A31_04095 [Acinetobacter suaedae]|uniref:YheC/YheD family protein n=1 Tax=Acinetobacter suaedae TaxID=2609668 RepID=A0A5P1US23_9GAMM|nr:YheC/YheD family protein [Acinetobacter sp. C16S1]QER38923.1 hypothetical protein F2A31_04095 [Acinetobacter sp. C16S1]